jgi:uncharacterized membrane protein YgcG
MPLAISEVGISLSASNPASFRLVSDGDLYLMHLHERRASLGHSAGGARTDATEHLPMKHAIPILALVAGGAALIACQDAAAQSLSDRINHVMQQKTKAQNTNASKARMLGMLLYTDISVQFDQTPARDAIKYLQTVLGITIIGRYSDDRAGVGIDPETPITIDVTDKPALSVLELVLEQCSAEGDQCTWQIREGFVEVGTKERLATSDRNNIRYYSIRDLLFEPPMFDNAPTLDLDAALQQGQQGGGGGGGGGGGFGGGGGGGVSGGGGGGGSIIGEPGGEVDRIPEAERAQQIIDIITETVEPESWDINGGDWATIRYYQGTLIIRAPDFIQRQIGGYPFAIRPGAERIAAVTGSRYVMFTGGASNVSLTGLRTSEPIGGTTGSSAGAGAGSGATGGASGSDSSTSDGKAKPEGKPKDSSSDCAESKP